MNDQMERDGHVERRGWRPARWALGAALGLAGAIGSAPTAVAAPTPAVIITEIDTDTTEDGSNGRIRVQLSTEPTAAVTIPVSRTDATEGNLTVSSIVLDSSNWFDGFDLSVTPGSSGDGNDGDVQYEVSFGDPTSTDAAYDALEASDVPDVDVINRNIDGIVGIIVTESGDSSEDGSPATVTYRLTQSPSGPVSFTVSSSDTTEGAPTTTAVMLDSSNFSSGVAIQVDGVDDTALDGDVTYQLVAAAATSTDSSFNGQTAPNANLLNVDDESAGVVVTVVDGVTDENGDTATVQFSLTAEPGSAVTIPLSLDDATEGSLGAVSEIVIAVADWNNPSANVVTVTGIDDTAADDVDGDQTFALVTGDPTSDDRGYEALSATDAADASLTNTDLDTAADLQVSAATALDLVAGGSAATLEFTIVNNGPSAAAGVVLDVDLPAGVALAPAASSLIAFDSCTATTGGATCAIGAVPNGETVEVSIDVVVTDPAATESTSAATATVSATTADPTAGNDAADGSIVVSRSTNISVAAAATTDDSGRSGFDVTVTNAGPSTGGATLTFTLPTGATLATTSDAACVATGSSVSCAVADLAADASVVVSVVLDGEVSAGDVTIAAAGAFNDGDTSDNTAVVGVSAPVVTTTTTTTTTPATTPTTTTVPGPSSDLPATGSSGPGSLLWLGLLALVAGAGLTVGVRRSAPRSTN